MKTLSILGWALAAATSASSPQWAMIGISESEAPTVHFVDRSSIKATPDGASAWTYAVSNAVSVKLHFEYDCSHGRYRFLEVSLPEGATPNPGVPSASAWATIKPGSPIHLGMRYACSGGKIAGLPEVIVPFASPEAFAREFLARRAQRKSGN